MLTRSAFHKQLGYLEKHYTVVSLDEIVARRHEQEGLVALTFDDGYMDNYLNALPILKSRGLPATVFTVANQIETGVGFWGNRLARMIAANGPQTLVLDNGSEQQSFPFSGRYKKQMKEAQGWVASLTDEEREKVLAPPHDDDRFLDMKAIRHLEENQVGIESHTVSHPFLTRIDAAEVAREVAQSKQDLECLLARPVNYFAYPYGDFDRTSRAAVASAGYRAAFTTRPGRLGAESDLFTVPRIGTREDFRRFVRGVSLI